MRCGKNWIDDGNGGGGFGWMHGCFRFLTDKFSLEAKLERFLFKKKGEGPCISCGSSIQYFGEIMVYSGNLKGCHPKDVFFSDVFQVSERV